MSKVKFLIGDSTDHNRVQNVDGQFIIAVDDSQLNAYVDYDNNGTVTRKQIGGKVTGVKGDSESSYRSGNVNITPANIGLGNVGNFKAVSTAASQGLTTTEQENARTNIGAGTSSFSGDYPDLTNKPTLGDAAAKGVEDSSSAGAISTGTSLVTERDVYYGLPQINGAHDYTSGTSLYAPIAKATGTVSGSTLAITDANISGDNMIDGPYVDGLAMPYTAVSVSGTTVTYTFFNTSADTKDAYVLIWKG